MRYKRVLLLVVLAVAALSIAIANVAAARSLALTALQTSPLATLVPTATPTPRAISDVPTIPADDAPRFPLGYARVQYPLARFSPFDRLLDDTWYPRVWFAQPANFDFSYLSPSKRLSLSGRTLLLNTGVALQAFDRETLAPLWRYVPEPPDAATDAWGIRLMAQTQHWIYLITGFPSGYSSGPGQVNEQQLIKLRTEGGQPVWRKIIERGGPTPSQYRLWVAPEDAPNPNVYLSNWNDYWIIALNAADGNERWRVEQPCYNPIAGSKSFFARGRPPNQPDGGISLFSFDSLTGARYRLEGLDSMRVYNLAYADGTLLAYTTMTADEVSLAAYDEFSDQLRWSRSLVIDMGAPSAALLDDSGLAVRMRKTVFKFDVRSGVTLWQTDLLDSGGSGLFLAGQVLWVMGETGFLHALDWQSGLRLGTQNLLDTLNPAPSWTRILDATSSELLVAFSLGGEQWGIARLAPDASPVSSIPSPTPLPSLTPPVSQPNVIVMPTPRALPERLVFPTPTPAPTLPVELKWDSEHRWADRAGAAAVLADADDDGAQEWIISREQLLGDQLSSVNQEAHPQTLEYLLFEPSGAGYTLVASWSSEIAAFYPAFDSMPRVLTVSDINGDGRSEIVFHAQTCGASICSVRLSVWQWDGKTLHNLAKKNIGTSYAVTTFTDLDGDGATEIVLRGGLTWPAAGLQRERVFVYHWQGGQYTLAESYPTESKFAYFRVVDAQEALRRGNLTRALELARQVVASPREGNLRGMLDFAADEEARIVSYAALQVMIVHAARAEPDEMAFYLGEIKRQYSRPSNPYVEIAQLFFDRYQATGSVVAACATALPAIRNLGSDAQLLRPASLSPERIEPTALCPPSMLPAPPQQLPQTGGERPFNFGQLRWGR